MGELRKMADYEIRQFQNTLSSYDIGGGQLDLFLGEDDDDERSSSKKSTAEREEIKRFNTATLLQIDQLQANELVDTGNAWDKQDPRVKITIKGHKTFETSRKVDAGTDATFEESFEYLTPWESKMTFDVEVANVWSNGHIKHQLGKGNITVDIDNIYRTKKGSELQKVHLEKGTVSFRLQAILVDEVGKKREQPIQPVQAKEQVSQQLDKIDFVNSDNTLSGSNLLFQIDKLKASNLVDTGHFADKQDPSLTITLISKQTVSNLTSNTKSFQTARQCDAGKAATFPENFEYTTGWTPSMVVQVDVWNVGKRGFKKHSLGCGEATIDIESLVGNDGDQIVLNIPLLINNIASQGTVSLRLKVFPVDETGKRSHPSLQAQESPKSRYNVLCEIENLRVSDLINTGTLADHQDPSLTITLDGRSFHTERKVDAGVEASFDEKFQFITTWVSVMELDVEVWNQSIYGIRKHVGIGKTTMTVENICSEGGEVDLDIPLIHTSVDGTIKNQGVVSLSLRLSRTTDDIQTQLVGHKRPSSYQPYSIAVSVISASNLPVSDFQTSDPYVVVFCGNNRVGETKTISGNLNPSWGHNGQGEEFRFDTLHIHKLLTFNIYDSNTSRSHVLLGVAEIPLSKLSSSSHQDKYPIKVADRFAGTLKDPSELLVSIVVKKNVLVHINPDHNHHHTAANPSIEYIDLIKSEMELLSKPVGEVVSATIHDLMTKETEKFIDKDFLQEIFRDIKSIATVSVDRKHLPISSSSASYCSWKDLQLFRRTHLNIFNGRKIDFISLSESYFSPIEKNSLHINLAADCKRFVVLQSTNRYSMWTWAKWLLALDSAWRNGSPLPDWAKADEFDGQITVRSSSDGGVVTGRGYVTRMKPYQLKVNDVKFDLSSMVNIILSADSERPNAYVLDGEILSSSEDFKTRSTETVPQHRESVFGKVKGAVKNTVSAVKDGTAGIGFSKLAAGSSMATNEQQESGPFVSIHFQNYRCLSALQAVDRTERFYFDVESNSRQQLKLPSKSGERPSLPGYKDSSPNLYVYLQSGKGGVDKVYGHKCISMSKLLISGQKCTPNLTAPTKISSIDRFCDPSPYDCSLDLTSDDSFGYQLTLLEIENLKVASHSNSLFGSYSQSLLVTFRLTDENGISLAGGKRVKMPSHATATPTKLQWNADNIAKFYPTDGLANSSFVKIKIALSSNTIGSAFVPLHYFQLRAQELSFPVICNNDYSEAGSVVYVKVVIQIDEKVHSQAAAAVISSLQLRTVIRESSIFNSTWHAECLLQGAIATVDPSKEVERFLVYPAMEGLLLFDNSDIGSATRTDSNWRLAAYRSDRETPVALCKERQAPELPVVVSWDQVVTSSTITSSLLWIQIEVSRYFGEHKVEFRPALVDVFVSNCPASELQALIEERKWFYKIRSDIQHVAESKSMQVKVQLHDDRAISLGSQIIAELDSASLELESAFKDLNAQYKQRNEKSVAAEMSLMVRRNLRIRLYIAALLGIGLKVDHNFDDEEIRSLLVKDFEKCRMIEKGDDVTTANSRIEFLLDMAEQRLRDTALCGWAYRGTSLKGCLDVLVNEYFIEIINHLGEFFDNEKLKTVRGFGSRDGLINMYMAHNDRLKVVLIRSLWAYDLRPSPDPTISLFLSFDTLLHWYSSAQLKDMKTFVSNAMTTYSRDHQKGQNPLPWSLGGGDSRAPAHTDICRELVSVLSIYLIEEKKLPMYTISESFSSRIKEYCSTLSLQYISSFTYLASLYSDALDKTNSRIPSDADEFEDHISFLYSVANDTLYAQSSKIFPPEVIDTTEYAQEVRGMRANFARVQFAALEQLLSVFIRYLFFHIKEPQLLHVSLSTVATSPESHIPDLLKDTIDYLEGNRQALELGNFVKFCSMVVEIWVQYLFWIMYSLWNPSVKFSFHDNKGALDRLHLDIKSVNRLACRLHLESDMFSVREGVCAVLNCAYVLLSEAEDSKLSLALKSLSDMARAEPCRAEAIANLIEVCRDLRSPAHVRSSLAAASEVEHRRRSSFVEHLGHAIAHLVPSHHTDKQGHVHEDTDEGMALHSTAAAIREAASNVGVQQVSSPRVMYPEITVFRSLTTLRSVPSFDDLLSNSMVSTQSTGPVDSSLAQDYDNTQVAFSSKASSSSSSSSSSYTVKISKLQVQNIFRFSRLVTFKSFLQIDCCGRRPKPTSTRSGYNPSWIDDEPIELSVDFGDNQDVNLRIALMDYAPWRSSKEIGHVSVILFQRSQRVIEQQQQPFELAEGNKEASEAAEKAKNEHLPLPSLSFAIELCSHLPS